MGKFDLKELIAEGKVSNLGTKGNREQIEYIHIDLIDDDPNSFYELSGIDELAANIELLGLQQPIRVRANPEAPDRVIIVSGHRRRAAIRKLVDEGREDLAEIPCIREVPAESAALQELRLIYANSDTRKMSAADISKQAERVEMLLYQLKEEGYEFPGRMRDHVAEACNVSKSKLARLKVIREGLSPDYKDAFDKGTIPEHTAYLLARFPLEFQRRLFRVCSIKDLRGYGVDHVCRLYETGKRWEPQMTCPDGKACTHGDAALRHDLDASYESCGGERCCLTCDFANRNWSPCERMCSKAKAKKKAEKKAEDEKNAKETEKRVSKVQKTTAANAQRLLAAIDAAGVSDKVTITWDWRETSVAKIREYAEGKFDGDSSAWYNARLNPEECRNPAKIAKKLGCSADFLLGLTDDPKPIGNVGKADGAGVKWYPRSVEPNSGTDIVVIDDLGLADNGKYFGGERYEGSIRWSEVVMWTLAPTEDAVKAPTADPPVEGWVPLQWINGMECPQKDGQMAIARFRAAEGGSLIRQIVQWNAAAGQWCFPSHGATIDSECVRWFPLPEEEC